MTCRCVAADSAAPATPAPNTANATAASNAPPPIVFAAGLPHSLGLKRLVNAGSRSADADRITLAVLAPEEPGLAANSQPRFWWYISDAFTNPVEFTLNQDTDTLLKVQVASGGPAGLQVVDLSQLGAPAKDFKLEPDKFYQWTIRLCKGDDPAVQPVSVGWVKWQVPDSALTSQVAGAADSGTAAVYAGSGYWYDAVDNLATRVTQHPDDQNAPQQLRSLMEQARLKEVELAPGKSP